MCIESKANDYALREWTRADGTVVPIETMSVTHAWNIVMWMANRGVTPDPVYYRLLIARAAKARFYHKLWARIVAVYMSPKRQVRRKAKRMLRQ